ncbi:hypothetical protein DFH28DRAFT_1089226 [Melampsora americana]|nr:hypothetical protein DFH28DRAFT_1089226 [Melampsora americana]
MTSTSENTIIPFTSPSKKPSQPQHKSSNLKLTRPSLSTLTSSLSRTKSSIASPIHHHTLSSNQITTPIPTHSSSSTSSFSIGDRVKSANQIIGKCAYIGTIHQKTGIWVGIDLSYPLHDLGQPAWYGKGKNSGSVNGLVFPNL